jgi:hypothetical protein
MNIKELDLSNMPDFDFSHLKIIYDSHHLRSLSSLNLRDSNFNDNNLLDLSYALFTPDLERLCIAKTKVKNYKTIIAFLNGIGIKDSEQFDFQYFCEGFIDDINIANANFF